MRGRLWLSDRELHLVRQPDGRPLAVRYAEPVKYALGEHSGVPTTPLKSTLARHPVEISPITLSCSVFSSRGLPGLLPSCLPSGPSHSILESRRWTVLIPRPTASAIALRIIPCFRSTAACPGFDRALVPVHLLQIWQL